MNDIERKHAEHDIDDQKIRQSYQAYINDVQVDEALHKRLLEIPTIPKAQRTKQKRRLSSFTHIAASICILIISVGLLGSAIFLFRTSGGTDKASDCAPMPDRDKVSAKVNIKDEKNSASDLKPAENSENIAIPKMAPLQLSTSKDTTYSYFSSVFDSLMLDANTQSDTIDPNSVTIDTLSHLLPATLTKTLTAKKRESELYNSLPVLLYNFSAAKPKKGSLSVAIHPMYGYERALVTASANIAAYSLNPAKNDSLPTELTDYTSTLLYPIFKQKELTKEVIAARKYTKGSTTSFSFGVQTSAYVITYEAIGFTADELAMLLLE